MITNSAIKEIQTNFFENFENSLNSGKLKRERRKTRRAARKVIIPKRIIPAKVEILSKEIEEAKAATEGIIVLLGAEITPSFIIAKRQIPRETAMAPREETKRIAKKE